MRGAPLPRGYAVCFRTTLRSLSLHKGKADETADLTVALSICWSNFVSARDRSCPLARATAMSAQATLEVADRT